MKNSFLKTMLFSTLTVSLFACTKSVENNSNLEPAQGELTANITLGTNTLAFKASGLYCQAIRQNLLGTPTIGLSGAIASGNFSALNVQFINITKTGTYNDGDLITIAGTLDGMSLNMDKSFISDDKVSLTITKISDNEVEGTFSCDITNLNGTTTGKITGGKFKGRFQ